MTLRRRVLSARGFWIGSVSGPSADLGDRSANKQICPKRNVIRLSKR